MTQQNQEKSRPGTAMKGSWRGDISAAIRGVPQDYTEGPIGRAILLLAVPMVLETSMFSVFAVFDAYFVARLGSDAVAAVGLTDALLSAIFAIGLGLGIGTAATVARRIGEKNAEEASATAAQAIGLAILAGLIFGAGGAIFAEPLLRAMGADDSLIRVGLGYMTHIFGGAPLILLLFVINACFRGAGDPVLALRTLALANLLNIVLDPIFIFGLGPVPAFGVTGAAMATNISRGLGVLYQLSVLLRGQGQLRIRLDHLRWRLERMLRLLRVSGVAIFQFLIATTSFTGLVKVLTPYSADALAGYTLAMRVIVFVLLPAWGMANASATLVGQNLGAKKPERAERSVWLAARYNFFFLGTVGFLMFTLARPIISIFTADDAAITYGVECLKIVSLGYWAMAFGMAMISAFNGAGDTMTPTRINFFCHWLLKLPLAWFLTWGVGWGPRGVFVAIPVAEIVVAIVAIVLFHRGSWKTQEI